MFKLSKRKNPAAQKNQFINLNANGNLNDNHFFAIKNLYCENMLKLRNTRNFFYKNLKNPSEVS